jgi:AcrR family transcriptional regulator
MKDRRVQRTQNLLREALVSLMHEKDYDSIVVKEILDRANVGRSAFYTHFRDKDELLVSGIHHILGSARSTGPSLSAESRDRMLWFSLPIFEYVDPHRHAGEPKMGTKGRALIHEHLRKVLAQLIAEEVGLDPVRRKPASRIPSQLLVQYVASTFILVLNWWIESRSRLTPAKVNDLFRSLVLPTLAVDEKTSSYVPSQTVRPSG